MLFLIKGHLYILFDSYIRVLFFLIFLFGCFTKRSNFPFRTWLPVAMAAPTPVSALVHSSTLVTAGIYIIIRFFKNIKNKFLILFLLLRIITIFIASFAALVENDSKKIIAFSTLSQLGLMFFCLFLGLKDIAFFHLIIHAFFKSLMFLIIGFLLVNKFHFQDIRLLSNLNKKKNFLSYKLLFVKFSLSGFFFFGSFYVKDLIYEKKFFIIKIIFLTLFYLRLIFTFLYSFRLLKILFFNNKTLKPKIKKQLNLSIELVVSTLLLTIFSVMVGFFFFFFLDFCIIYNFCTFKKKFLIILIVIISFLFIRQYFFLEIKKKYLFYKLFFLEFFRTNFLRKKFFNLRKYFFYVKDKILFKMNFLKKIINKMRNKLKKIFLFLKKFKGKKYLLIILFIFIYYFL